MTIEDEEAIRLLCLCRLFFRHIDKNLVQNAISVIVKKQWHELKPFLKKIRVYEEKCFVTDVWLFGRRRSNQ